MFNPLNYKKARAILEKGIPLENRPFRSRPRIPGLIPVTEDKRASRIAYEAAIRTRQMEGLGQEDGIVSQIQAGSFIPDDLLGISTKAVLAVLLVLALVKK